MADEFEITKGWKYSVKNTKDEVIQGTFKGYSMIGGETAMVLESSSIMYVPVSKILCITLTESGPAEEPKKKEQGVHYG
jgi:hypothetical protein